MLGPGQADQSWREHSVISPGVFVFLPVHEAASEEWAPVDPKGSFMALSSQILHNVTKGDLESAHLWEVQRKRDSHLCGL